MNKLTMREATRLYREGNNAGRGYAPDAEDIDEVVRDLVNNYEGEVLLDRTNSDEVAVVLCGDGEMVAIGGDAMGRNVWAVKISPES